MFRRIPGRVPHVPGRAWPVVAVAAGLLVAGMFAVPAAAPADSSVAPPHMVVCPAPRAGQATCAGESRAGSAATPAGLSPASLQDAYGLQATYAGMRQTVAVVTAFDDPTAGSDLAAYRAQYGLPACSAANGCFAKVSETGTTSYPPPGTAAWTASDAASLDMISAICPNCHILLVEATTTGITDLGTAENEAVDLGAGFVTNTWISAETSGEAAYDTGYFDHPGIVITAPSSGPGFSGYGTSYPAASPDVISVGGTLLVPGNGSARGWTEKAWNGTGSGCSKYESKPSWQTDTGCKRRTLNDLSAVASPQSPVAIYDTTSASGWGQGSGDVVASAIVAATYALAGTPAGSSAPASYPYLHRGMINDVIHGADGTCTPKYLCSAKFGYDGPSGLGTPASSIPFIATGAAPAGEITSGVPGDCLDNHNGTATPGNVVDITGCSGAAGAQMWAAESNGTIDIQGLCLDVAGSGTTVNTPVDVNTCGADGSQGWRARYPDELENVNSHLCLEAPGNPPASGAQLVIAACDGQSAQAGPEENWALPYRTPTATGEVTSALTSGSTTYCLDNFHATLTNGNVVDLFSCNGGKDSQVWAVAANDTIQIGGTMCLDVVHSGIKAGTLVDLYHCNNTGAQQWVARSDGTLLNPESGLCLDNPKGAVSGTQLDIARCRGNTAQRWILPQ
jgi:hypothetical protein